MRTDAATGMKRAGGADDLFGMAPHKKTGRFSATPMRGFSTLRT